MAMSEVLIGFGIGVGLGVAPGLEGAVLAGALRLHGDHLRPPGQLGGDALDVGDHLGADEDDLGVAVGDDIGHLRRGQPPADRRGHHPGLGRAEPQLEIEVAVLADIGDPVAGLQARRDQGVGDLAGLAVEFGEGGVAALEAQRHGARPDLAVIAGDVAQGRHAVEVDG
jgi:hypothetical protein